MHFIAILLSLWFYIPDISSGIPVQTPLDCLCDQQIDTLYVYSINDGGPGSLRCAIECANEFPSYNFIRFDLQNDSTIVLETPLPELKGFMTIISEQGKITLDGKLLTEAGDYGLRIAGDSVHIEGLILENFPNNAIDNYQGHKYLSIHDNIIKNNGQISEFGDGIDIRMASDCSITNNLIRHNKKDGIYVQSCNDILILGNKILENSMEGIFVYSSDSVMIGDSCNNCSNLISGNKQNGIRAIENSKNIQISNNLIGISISGQTAFPNEKNGVVIEKSSEIQIGGPGSSNYISGNGIAGIEISDSSSLISLNNNFIGLSPFQNVGIPNAIFGLNILGSYRIQIGGDSLINGNVFGNDPIHVFLGDSSLNCSIRHNEFGCSVEGIVVEPGSNNASSIIGTLNIEHALLVTGTAISDSDVQLYKKNGQCVSCQGSFLIGSAITDATGYWEISLSEPLLDGEVITMIITDEAGNSSKFSDCVEFQCESFDVSINTVGLEYLCEGGELGLQTDIGEIFLWSTGETTSEILIYSGGNYAVTVLNENGCPASDTIFINTQESPELSFSVPDSSFFCENSSLIKANGSGYFEWDSGETGPVLEVNESGTYCVSLTNVFECTVSDCVTLFKGEIPTASIEVLGDTSFCNGENVQLVASGGSVYKWSTGEYNMDTIRVYQSGTYTLTVTNEDGCEDLASQEIIVYPSVNGSIMPEGLISICEGDSILLEAQGGSIYNWGNGTQGPFLSVDALGVYFVTIENEFGCFDHLSKIVSVNPNPDAEIIVQGSTQFCEGDSVILQVGGTPLDSIVWNGSYVSDSLTVYQSGNMVAEMFSYGCTTSDTIEIEVFALPSISNIQGPDWAHQDSTQIFYLEDPDPELQFYWSVAGGIMLSENGMPEIRVHWSNGDIGEICVIAVDANQCKSAIKCKEVDLAPLKTAVNSGKDEILLFPNPTSGMLNISIFPESEYTTLSVEIHDENGGLEFKTNISPQNDHYIKELDLKSLSPGIYTMKIMDGNNLIAVKKLILL